MRLCDSFQKTQQQDLKTNNRHKLFYFRVTDYVSLWSSSAE